MFDKIFIESENKFISEEHYGNIEYKWRLDLKNELGQSFLIVTQNEELAAQSDRVWSMRDGQIH